MTTLAVSGLHTFYAKSHILHDVGFEVREGEIVALLGRNGAGKTTTLRSVMGLTPARSGTIRIFDQETTDWPPFRVAALGVGYVPEGRRIFSNLTVDENLDVPLERPGHWSAARIYELVPRLAERRSNRGGQLSGGEQEMLAIGRALLLNPQLLVLDEPSQGLAPLIVKQVFQVVASMRKEGIAVLLVEQNVRAAIEIADRVYVLDDGQVVHEQSAAEFGRDEERLRALAGVGAETEFDERLASRPAGTDVLMNVARERLDALRQRPDFLSEIGVLLQHFDQHPGLLRHHSIPLLALAVQRLAMLGVG